MEHLTEKVGRMQTFILPDANGCVPFMSALTYKKSGRQRDTLGILTGDKLYQYFTQLMRHVTVTDFYDLPIPYAAVATDIRTGEKVVLHGGSLPSVMRVSMIEIGRASCRERV